MQLANFKEIDNITDEGIELLAAVGVEDLTSLAESDPAGLVGEMEQANSHLQLDYEVPGEEAVAAWIDEAREITNTEVESSVVRLVEEVAPNSENIVEAMPVKKEYIIKHQIEVSDVPVMEDFVGEGELQAMADYAGPALEKESVAVREIASKKLQKKVVKEELEIDDERERAEIEPLKSAGSLDIRKAASEGLNEGKKMHSRGYIRGVLHPQPGRVKMGGIVTLFTLLLLPASFIAAGYFILQSEEGAREDLFWLLAFPIAFLIFGFFYLTMARPVKCRICGQPVFSPKSCRRHVKAHHIPFLGYILPTSIQLLLFHWFRCIYCGTSIRLKE